MENPVGTFKIGSAVAANVAVVSDSGNYDVALPSGAGVSHFIGITTEQLSAAGYVGVALPGSIVDVVCMESIDAMSYVKIGNSSGEVADGENATATATEIIGILLEAGTANNKAKMLVQPSYRDI